MPPTIPVVTKDEYPKVTAWAALQTELKKHSQPGSQVTVVLDDRTMVLRVEQVKS